MMKNIHKFETIFVQTSELSHSSSLKKHKTLYELNKQRIEKRKENKKKIGGNKTKQKQQT